MRFAVKIWLTNPIGLFKNSPFIGASSFYLEFSSLRIYGLSCLGRRRVYV